MNDNVIKFKKRQPVKPPRQTPPWLRRVLVILGIVAAFAAAYTYFALTGSPARAAVPVIPLASAASPSVGPMI